MTKEEFVLSIKRAASAFLTDGPDIGDGTAAEWTDARDGWLQKLAKDAVDAKRTAKARRDADALHARAKAAGLEIVTSDELIEGYDKDMARLRVRIEQLEEDLQASTLTHD